MSEFEYQPLFELGPDITPYRSLGAEGVSTLEVEGTPAPVIDDVGSGPGRNNDVHTERPSDVGDTLSQIAVTDDRERHR